MIAPYGVYQSADKVPILISIQNDREFTRLCEGVLDWPGLDKDPDFATNKARNSRRDETNKIVSDSFGAQSFEALSAKLDAAQIAWARVSSVGDLSRHPQVKRMTFGSPKGEVSIPALAASYPGQSDRLGDVPNIGQHTEQVRHEFPA
jgi:formyl-CoA transferase